MKQAILFDAYGTLFDVYSIATLLEQYYPAQGVALAAAWRDKQIEYTRLVTTSNGGVHYRPFDVLTLAALRSVCAARFLELNSEQEGALIGQYMKLMAFNDAHSTLAALKARGAITGILSNGTPTMLEAATQSAGLVNMLDHVLSVDTLNPPQYKTASRAYELGTKATGLAAQDIAFVSSNAWDVLGAAWFGYYTIWVNRNNVPWEALGTLTNARPAHTISQLSELLDII
jgi:2-haloacid dehalogenase